MKVDEAVLAWREASLLEVADLIRGVSYKRDEAKSEPGSGLVPVLRANNINGATLNFADLVYVPECRVSQEQRIRRGDIVLAMSSGSRDVVGKAALASDDWAGGFGAFCGVLRTRPGIDARYVARFLQSADYRRQIDSIATGTNINNLSKTTLKSIELPIAPHEIQASLSALLDTIEEKRRSGSAHLNTAKRALDRFRQAVLGAACSGRLTTDWREQRDLPSVSELLAELRAARQEAKTRRTSIQPPSTDELDELPAAWDWAAVGEIGEVQLGGTPSRKEAAYWSGGVPWVSSGEVANCRISSTRETITEAGLANSSAKLYPAGTVLIAMIGEGKTRGQAAILDIEASTNQNAAGVVPDRNIVDPEYLWRWALAQYEVTRAVGRGGNQPALNGQKVRELTIPVPPLEEQHEIVRRVDQLLALADGLKRRIEIASTRIDRSSHAILAKAFRGDLSINGHIG